MTPARQNPALAALFIFAASALLAGTTLLAKALGTDTLGPPLHPMQISHGRFLFAFLVIVSAVAVMRPTLRRPHWRLHIGRTSFGWLGITLMFASVAYIPMADATAISFLNPVFAMVLAIPLLKEGVGPWRWLAAAVALIGALILLRPTPASFQAAALLALTAAAVIGMELIFIKKLSGREIPIQILLVNNSMGLAIATVAVIAVWQTPTSAQWAALAGIGVLMACAQACFVNGMARADASFVAPISYATLIFAAFYDFVVFDVIPDRTSLIGSAIILAGGLILVWREARVVKRPSVRSDR
ncbi:MULTISPECIES: DMT family transporter [unclassified Ruegeria]|uniref:DMT family transporter n=1 Tax=unclassified Ruegeria TaxID=2625375 RepID=UPI00148871E3|nr:MULTISPECIES: DMT family transporter [unclassified Ruegeria]NOD77042.1 EamA family transporter [Ruegeria sp. HKCCD4332]NOD89513.1 EamA family transporter [Ruegeria sp. HKCCD4318]NOE13836.1 EamA family transporter [Ruegeria sp. HKCCD4318-2]NOG08229.1 DMT family transporter [Ruegeria sp. HKCCD4315]